jgi:hypothetical protein
VNAKWNCDWTNGRTWCYPITDDNTVDKKGWGDHFLNYRVPPTPQTLTLKIVIALFAKTENLKHFTNF